MKSIPAPTSVPSTPTTSPLTPAGTTSALTYVPTSASTPASSSASTLSSTSSTLLEPDEVVSKYRIFLRGKDTMGRLAVRLAVESYFGNNLLVPYMDFETMKVCQRKRFWT